MRCCLLNANGYFVVTHFVGQVSKVCWIFPEVRRDVVGLLGMNTSTRSSHSFCLKYIAHMMSTIELKPIPSYGLQSQTGRQPNAKVVTRLGPHSRSQF